MASVNYLAYKNALKQAWKDGKMSADESAMLDTLRKSLNISAEEHIHIEREVRNELAGLIPDSVQIGNIHNANGGGTAVAEEPVYSEPEPAVGGAELSHEELLQSDDIKQLLISGKNAYHKGNFEDAIEFCDKVLLLEPDNSEALFFRKRTLSKIEKIKGKNDKAPAETTSQDAAPAPANEKPATKQDAADIEAAIDEIADMKLEPEAMTAPNNPQPANPGVNSGAGNSTGGDPNCKSCGGSGSCHWCQGSGKCYWCKGTGNCDKCKGKGEINGEECKSCKGSGKCHSCNGDSNCYWCKGTGKCSKCSL